MSRHRELKDLLLGLRFVLCSLFWNRTANTFCCRVSAFTICWTYHSLSPKPCLFNENRDGRTNSISQNTAGDHNNNKKTSTYFPIWEFGRGMTQKGKSHFYLSRSEKMLSLSETSESGSRMCGSPLHQWERVWEWPALWATWRKPAEIRSMSSAPLHVHSTLAVCILESLTERLPAKRSLCTTFVSKVLNWTLKLQVATLFQTN